MWRTGFPSKLMIGFPPCKIPAKILEEVIPMRILLAIPGITGFMVFAVVFWAVFLLAHGLSF